MNFGAGKSAGCWSVGWGWTPRKPPGGFLFFKVRLAPKCRHKRHGFVVSEFRESCGVWAHPCCQDPRTVYWGLFPVPQKRAEAGRSSLGTARSSAAPGSSVLPLPVPTPEPSHRCQDYTGERRAESVGCGLSQQVVWPGSWPGLNIKGWAAQGTFSWSSDVVT